MSALFVSVIATVFNERKNIERLLESLADQSRRPDEVVICDGGSTDGTAQFIEDYAQSQTQRLPNLKVIIETGANISRGRNLAIAAAQGPIIAVTDAGVRLDRRWLECLMKPWEESGQGDKETRRQGEFYSKQHATRNTPIGVAGFFLPDVQGAFQVAMAATVLPLQEDIDPAKFLPSSRSVAFLKEAWAQIGGYPEWLDYCEDLIFDLKIIANCELVLSGGEGLRMAGTDDNPKSKIQNPKSPWVWAADALVYFRPRENLRSFWTQYYRYARGDGKADLWRKRHAIRYATYLVAFPALLGHALWGFVAPWLGWLGLLAGIAFYCRRPWQRLAALGQSLTMGEKVMAALYVPLIRAVGDVAKMVGYPVGLWWRWQNRKRTEIWWK